MKRFLLIIAWLLCVGAFIILKGDKDVKTQVIEGPKERLVMLGPKVQEKTREPIHEERTVIEASTVELPFVQQFEYFTIDKHLEERINGVSWKQGSPVEIGDLRLVKVTYWGFDEQPHIGELIVNQSVAKEIVEIFEVLYASKFPIDKIKLIDDYEAEDSKSMKDNNTSAFCFREVDGKPGKLSKHSYGIAIDINPVQNPYVYKGEVSPIEGKAYIDRSKLSKGMIVKGDVCYKAFLDRGWTWGGDWKYEKDYQHFQKNIQ